MPAGHARTPRRSTRRGSAPTSSRRGSTGSNCCRSASTSTTPSELFDSPGTQPVLDQLHLLADIILLDTPPVLSAPDTAILGSLTHGAIVVATEGRTDRGDLERTARRLEATGCRVVGLVLNHVRHSAVGQLPGLHLQAMNPASTAPGPVPSGDGDPLVVVVAYHAPDLLDRCLAGLGDGFDVVVVDNSSDAGWPESADATGRTTSTRAQPRLRRRRQRRDAPGGTDGTSCCSTPTPPSRPPGPPCSARGPAGRPGTGRRGPAPARPRAPAGRPGGVALPHAGGRMARGGRPRPTPPSATTS